MQSMTQAFVRNFLAGLKIGRNETRVSAATFASTTDILYNFRDYTNVEDVLTATSFVVGGRRTNTRGALGAVRSRMFTSSAGDRRGVPNVVVLLTDGGSLDRTGAHREALALRDAGFTIYVVAIGSHTHLFEVARFATRDTEPYVVQVRDAESSRPADVILDNMCRSRPSG